MPPTVRQNSTVWRGGIKNEKRRNLPGDKREKRILLILIPRKKEGEEHKVIREETVLVVGSFEGQPGNLQNEEI